jgi:hypothetical protein
VNWLNLDLMRTQKPEFLGATAAQRGAWMSMLAWCARVENGGRIAGAGDWNAAMWAASCGLQPKDLQKKCALWWFEGKDLILWGYPNEQEATTQKNRLDGKKGGRPAKPSESGAVNNPPVIPPGGTEGGNPKGKERKEKEKEEEGNETAAPPPVEPPEGFPKSEADAVKAVRAIQTPDAQGMPSAFIEMWWFQLRGQGFKTGSGQLVQNFGMFLRAKWREGGPRWLREAAGDDPKKNKGGAALPMMEMPVVLPEAFSTEPDGWRVVWPDLFSFAPPSRWLDNSLSDRKKLTAAALEWQKRKAQEEAA